MASRLLHRRALLAVVAVLFSAAALLYCALWMAAVRVAAPVELGYQSDYLADEQAQLVRSVEPGSPGERSDDWTLIVARASA